MKCPLCLDTNLDVTHHAGIEVDICPQCRGVWLDRGELERIASDARSGGAAPLRAPDPRDDRNDWDDRDDRDPRPSKKKRKKRLSDRLGDVFEELIDL